MDQTLVRSTPIVAASFIGPDVWLKFECLQRTGSFKLRGAVRACESLTEDERRRGLIVASAGNHGAAMALAAKTAGTELRVIVPRGTPETKMAKIERGGAQLEVFPGNYDEAEAFAISESKETGAVFVSAFDDERIIAGNGDWLADEIVEQHKSTKQVVLPVGGGGMIAGVARTLAPRGIRVVGAQPANNCAMHDSLVEGRALTDYVGKRTIAEGCEGAVGSLTYAVAAPHIDSVALVSEEAIEEAVRVAYAELGVIVECSGAVGLAALLTGAVEPIADTVCVLSGGNIDDDELARILGT